MTELILPPGVERPLTAEAKRGAIINETDLPDAVVQEAVQTHFEAHASLLGLASGERASFQTYASQGTLLNRPKFRTPGNVMEEISLARNLAERDDDIRPTMGAMIATAFDSGMQNTHEDEVTVALFDEIASEANLDYVLADMYRELLISSSLTTVSLFIREAIQFQPEGADRQRTRMMNVPLIGVLPAEQVYVLDNDVFRRGTLAYRPTTATEERFLEEYFSPRTSEGRRAEMRRLDPVLTTLVVGMVEIPPEQVLYYAEDREDPPIGNKAFLLNTRMVHRSTFPKGAMKYPRPLLTSNFALLEAKRLLNLMDYALLQGGSNFLIVAKKGTDQVPALPEEVTNLHEVIRSASRTGVIIGDHRLNIEIITPDLKELLNPQKRKLVGRKLAMNMLRVPESGAEDAGAEGMRSENEIVSRVITMDRRLVKRHVENHIYKECVKRNPGDFPKGAAKLWFPKIVLQGTQYFTDYVLKLRDRGDISRQSAVEAGGFSYKAEVQQRKREKANGDDRALTPPVPPMPGGPGGGTMPTLNDNPEGRPRGSGPNNGRPGAQPGRTSIDPAAPRRQLTRNAGETVRAFYEDDLGTYRVGELTYAVLEEYDSTRRIGRLTAFEARAVEQMNAEWPDEIFSSGPVHVVPVNPAYAVALTDLRAVRLVDGISILVGPRTDDGALVARALCFREPYTALDAEEKAVAWGFPMRPVLSDPESVNS